MKAAAVLKENGAKSVLALVTHGILSGSAIETLNGSVLSALVVTNTVPLGNKVERVSLFIPAIAVNSFLIHHSVPNFASLTSVRQLQRYVWEMVPFRIHPLILDPGHSPYTQR